MEEYKVKYMNYTVWPKVV